MWQDVNLYLVSTVALALIGPMAALWFWRDQQHIRQRLLLAQQVQDLTQRIEVKNNQLQKLEQQFHAERTEAQQNLILLAETRATLQQQQLTKQQLAQEFKQLAQETLQERGQALKQEHQGSLAQLLNPLREQLKDFSKQVNDTYDKESRERVSLKCEVAQLQKLNQQMSEEAVRLTQALQGQAKTQGCWGEMILARALEIAGLQQGLEYDLQVNMPVPSGGQLQPDAVIHLPEDRHVVVDAKVTLTAYNRFLHAPEDEQSLSLKQHVLALRQHIKQLGDKQYQNLFAPESLDFVLMFLPLEGAFSLAMQHDSSLYSEALAKNIILVTPTTLLAALRTIENLWRIEKQNRHAVVIAQKAGNLYDKFAGLCTDLQDVGKRLDMSQKAYQAAMNKLSTGKGNLLGKVEEMRKYGVKASKELPESLKQYALTDNEAED